MRVLGIDPGSHKLGWGIVERAGNRVSWLAHGVIEPEGELCDRLVTIDRELALVIAREEPAVGAVECLFFSKNARSAAVLGHARGVALLALRRAGLSVHEYEPALVKRAVVGRGRADKAQVAAIVMRLLALTAPPPSDAADALAVALAHVNSARYREALARRS